MMEIRNLFNIKENKTLCGGSAAAAPGYSLRPGGVRCLFGSFFCFQEVRLAKQVSHGAFDVGERFAHNRLSSNEDKVVSVFHTRYHRAKRFPQPAFDAIADDAVSDFFADGKANVDRRRVRLYACFCVDEHQLPGRLGLPFAVYVAEILIPLQRITAFHPVRKNVVFPVRIQRGSAIRPAAFLI